LTLQCRKKERERERTRKNEREKWIREREMYKREGARALCFILIYVISALS
jgi:hypothetical protein